MMEHQTDRATGASLRAEAQYRAASAVRDSTPIRLRNPVAGGDTDDTPLLAPHQVELVWQPVRDAREGATILYQEALVRSPDIRGWEAAPVRELLALERAGLAPIFDRGIVRRVIAELEADPIATLGVNISGQSADPDAWNDIFVRLRAVPGVARRLVIEITETAPLPSVDKALAFVAQARALGCRIALDDFGVGHTSLHLMLALAPSIIKIDALFVRRAASTNAAEAMFRHLVGLARSTGALVIVEGIETAEQAQLALDAGSAWQQGYLHGRPSRIRWRDSARTAQPCSVQNRLGAAAQVRGLDRWIAGG